MERAFAKPITSLVLIDVIASELRKRRPCYYFLYRLCIETGSPASSLISYKVKDLKSKKTFEYIYKNGDILHKETLTDKTYKEFQTYLSELPDDSYAFCACQDPSGKLSVQCFQKALYAVSKLNEISPPLSLLALRKTFVYHLFLKDPVKARTYTSARTVPEFYRYFGMEMPDKSEKLYAQKGPRTLFYESDLLDKVSKHFLDTAARIKNNTKQPDSSNEAYFIEATRFLTEVDSILQKYEDLL